MSVFIDASVLVDAVADSPYHDPCLRLLQAVARGEVDGRTSTTCLEEVWYLESSQRISGLDGLTERAYAILTPLLSVTDKAFRHASRFFQPHGRRGPTAGADRGDGRRLSRGRPRGRGRRIMNS